MNQFYRALHMPPKRLLRKVMGEKEVYTIAVRPRPTAEGTEPLPALDGGPYTLLPGREGWWFADPLLYRRGGKRWLYAEAMDVATGKSRIEVCELRDDGTIDGWRTALEEDCSLAFPMVFDWNGSIWMLPETGNDHSLRLYRCTQFPAKWELVQRFATDEALCDAILVDRRAEALTILCSETKPDNQLYVRYRRYTLRHAVQEAAMPLAEGTLCRPRRRAPLSSCPMKPITCSTATLIWSAATPGRCLCWGSRSSTPRRSAPARITASICSFWPGAAARKFPSAPPCPAVWRLPAWTPRTSSACTPTAGMRCWRFLTPAT